MLTGAKPQGPFRFLRSSRLNAGHWPQDKPDAAANEAAWKKLFSGPVKFNEVVRTEGDSFARYMIRLDEILESLSIIEQLIDNIPEGNYREKMKPIIKLPAGKFYSEVVGSHAGALSERAMGAAQL